MTDFLPPPELTRRKLSITRKGGKLRLTTPILRHPWLGALCILIPLGFWLLKRHAVPGEVSMTSHIEPRWLALVLDEFLPNPAVVPLPIQLVALGFVAIGVIIIFHQLSAVVDKSGIRTVHSLFLIPYYSAHIAADKITSFSMRTNGSFHRGNGEIDELYGVVANSRTPPQVKLCGISLKTAMKGKSNWEEWLAFSLPGQNAGDYVLSLVNEACPLPACSGNTPSS